MDLPQEMAAEVALLIEAIVVASGADRCFSSGATGFAIL
jgi:hypothetical protein